MIKRLVGLLIILSLVLPPFLAFGTVTVARGIADDLDAAARQRMQNIQQEITALRTSIQPLVNAIAALRATLNQVRTAINSGLNAINQIPTSLTIPAINLPSINFPQRTINIPDIPSFSLGSINVLGADIPLPSFPGFVTPNITFGPFTLAAPQIPSFSLQVPGLASAVNILRDGYNFIKSTVQGVIDLSGVDTVISSLGDVAGEVEGLTTDIGQIRDRWSDPLRWLGIGFAAWFLIGWLALLGSAFGYGWRLLTGQA